MGFVDKVKDLFTDVVEDGNDEPIKKEVRQVEITKPIDVKDEEKKDDKVIEEDVLKDPVEKDVIKSVQKEDKIWFDDSDFETLPKPEKKKPEKKKPVRKKDSSSGYRIDKKEVKKIFSPSPIISPVYGVLDKNYIKEDVKEKNKKETIYNTNTELSIDAIRKKAFGTLEDELEMGLYSSDDKKDVIKDEYHEKPKEEDIFDELDFNLDGVYDDEEVAVEIDKVVNKTSRTEKNKQLFDELLDSTDNEEEVEKDDLFDLIDDLYNDEEVK